MNRKDFRLQRGSQENNYSEVPRAGYLPIPAETEQLLESVYETCFCYELQKRELNFARQVNVPIIYDGVRLDETLRLDVVVDDKIICEIKAIDEIAPVHQAQLLTYLKLTNKRLGFLINFNVPLIKNGIKRMVL